MSFADQAIDESLSRQDLGDQERVVSERSMQLPEGRAIPRVPRHPVDLGLQLLGRHRTLHRVSSARDFFR